MKKLVLDIVKVAVVILFAQAVNAEEDYSGTWKSYEFNGVNYTQMPDCIVLQYVERIYDLQKSVDTYFGSYVKLTYGSFMNVNHSCKYKEQEDSTGIYVSGAQWSINSDEQSPLLVKAESLECIREGCSESEIKTFAKEWQSTVRMEKGGLIDGAIDSTMSSPLKFWRAIDLSENISAALPTLENMRRNIKDVDVKSFLENFIGPYGPQANNLTSVDMKYQLEKASPVYTALEGSHIIRSFYADNAVYASGTEEGPFVFFMSRLDFKNGSSGLEHTVFKYSDGWKYYYHYVSANNFQGE